jgi:2,4-dienoyl-CoA reductase (NADPH2)
MAQNFMQILHAGRYGYHPLWFLRPIKSPISPFKPRQMSEKNILKPLMIMHVVQVLPKRQAMMV